MLNSLRNSASGALTKILLALLILSFGIWGVGDMVSKKSTHHPLATIGNISITKGEYQQQLQREAEGLRRILGDHYTPEMLKSMNLDRQVLSKMVNSALLRQEAETLGVKPSDADVARLIRANPSYHDSKGHFDKALFQAMLKNSNQSEKAYAERLRTDMASNIIMETASSITPVSDKAVEVMYQVRHEQRVADLYSLTPEMITTVPQPESAALETYYKENIQRFVAPEQRTVGYITLKKDNIEKTSPVSEEAIQTAYKERIDEFKLPERRTVSQMLFGTEESARKAYEQIKAGKSFEHVAHNSDILNKNTLSLGTIRRTELVEGTEETVFSLQANAVSEPVKTPFGWHIFQVTKIEPPSVTPLSDISATLEKELRQHADDEALYALANKIEDSLAAGSTLKETADSFNLPYQTAENLIRNDDRNFKDLSNVEKFLETAFKTEEKTESSLVSSKDGSYFILRVENIVPERQRSLDEVRNLVVQDWQKKERQASLAAIAEQVAAKLSDPAKRSATISEYKLKPFSSGKLKRDSQSTATTLPLPAELVQNVFLRRQGEATPSFALANGNRMIGVVKEVIPAPVSGETYDRNVVAIRKEIQGDTGNEMLSQYLRYLHGKYPVDIDETMLQSMLQ